MKAKTFIINRILLLAMAARKPSQACALIIKIKVFILWLY